ncbi:MAG: hypothetical protein IJ272_02945 [Clostridia bacterium]|nr:hypothetical protein [Clostridia bacterium]
MFDSEEMVNAANEACKYVYKGIRLSKYFIEISDYAADFKYDEALEVLDNIVKEFELEIGRR